MCIIIGVECAVDWQYVPWNHWVMYVSRIVVKMDINIVYILYCHFKAHTVLLHLYCTASRI